MSQAPAGLQGQRSPKGELLDKRLEIDLGSFMPGQKVLA